MSSIPNILSEEISQDFFVLSTNGTSIAYSPLRAKAFVIKSEKGVDLLREYFQHGVSNLEMESFLNENSFLKDPPRNPTRKSPEYHPTELVLSLTSDCNLACSYCYASAGETHNTIPWEVVEKAIKIAVAESQKLGKKSFKLLFHGGGEASVRWNLVEKSTELVKNLWEGKKSFSIVTNATLINSQKAKWLKENSFHVSVSLDGPKDVHDLQRPKKNGEGSFEDCINGMLCLKEANVSFGIRTTICNSNLDRINELIIIAKTFDCGLKIEPLIVTGRANDADSISFERFYEKVLDAKIFAKRLGVKLKSTYFHGLKHRTDFCSGNGNLFCVLPDGQISSCSRVTKTEDDVADTFLIGTIDSNLGLQIDTEKVRNLKSLVVENFNQCKGCFAKWYCTGGCPHSRILNGDNMPEEHCRLTKALLFLELQKELSKI